MTTEVATIPTQVPGSITDLLRLAVERGTPVAELKELVALHEQMERREAARAFSREMAAFQREAPPIKKSSTAKVATKSGSSYSYTYAELDEIARTVNPILSAHGLSYSWDSKVEKDTLTCICTIRHEAGHSETASLTLPVENPSAMNPQQKVGAALTFAQRRTLASALGLTTTDEDTDAGAGADPTTITPEQVATLRHLIAQTKSNEGKFLKWLKVESLERLRVADYQRAEDALAAKLKQEGAA